MKYTIGTSHGSLAVEESGQGGIPVLLIYGNSSCRGVFRHQLQGRLAELKFSSGRSSASRPSRSLVTPWRARTAVSARGSSRLHASEKALTSA